MEISINEWRMIVPTLEKVDQKNSQWKKITNNRDFFSKFEKAIQVLNWSGKFRKRYQNYSVIAEIKELSETKPSRRSTYEQITIDDCFFFTVWIAMNYSNTFNELIMENKNVSKPVLKDETILASQIEYIENSKNRVIQEDRYGLDIMKKREKLFKKLMDQTDEVFESYDNLRENLEEYREFSFFLDEVVTRNIYQIDPSARDLERILEVLKKVKGSISSDFKKDILKIVQEIIYPDVSFVHIESIIREVKKIFKEKFPESEFLQQNFNIQVKNKKELSNASKKDQYELLDNLTSTYNKIFEL
ncbi:hypothetical protein [Enterococcus gilvus]|uniref:hypothetical protein n=1 Tax=Enterococcus gilvus TaxID=160453 RepID=UPI0029140B49|nr:hypothetical protein [Enterococcus gilvus]MDU5509807.1 hypothetical protein [Enterococcus gilvus]